LAWSDIGRRIGAGALTIVCGVMLLGCTGQPVEPYSETTPPIVLATIASADVRDLRAPYRDAVCRRTAADDRACADVLLRLPGEGERSAASVPEDLAQRYRVAFVPGFFSECFDRFVRPFADVERHLKDEGYTVDYFRVAGRGTTAQNAARLAEHFSSLNSDPRPIIVFAYSKGLPDVLEFVVRFPIAAQRVAAIVAVAGAANGSPLADNLSSVYRDWVAAFPLPGCEAGTGDEIHDLRPDVRLEWWRQNRAAVNVPVFSLVAAPRPDRVSPGTRATYRKLSQIDPRNDGKLLWYDQIVPGGYLLGYANADHWAIAMPVAKEFPGFRFLFRDDAPRIALIEAAIEIVAGVLAANPK